MSLTRGSEPFREQSARDLLERMHQRAVLNEGVGILQVWQACRQQQARDTLHTEHGASGRADPDASWD